MTTNYCNGVTSDDVVAHEWGHAYTEYTCGIYQWQPGALNESYSDIWGETVDLINGRRTKTRVTSPPSGPTACAPALARATARDHQLAGDIAKVCPAGPPSDRS